MGRSSFVNLYRFATEFTGKTKDPICGPATGPIGAEISEVRLMELNNMKRTLIIQAFAEAPPGDLLAFEEMPTL